MKNRLTPAAIAPSDMLAIYRAGASLLNANTSGGTGYYSCAVTMQPYLAQLEAAHVAQPGSEVDSLRKMSAILVRDAAIHICFAAKYICIAEKYICFSAKYNNIAKKYICLAAKYNSFAAKYKNIAAKHICLAAKYISYAAKYICDAANYINYAAKYNSFAAKHISFADSKITKSLNKSLFGTLPRFRATEMVPDYEVHPP